MQIVNPADNGFGPEWHVQCANEQYGISKDPTSPSTQLNQVQPSTTQPVVSGSDEEVSSRPSGLSTHSLDSVPLADRRKTRGQISLANHRAVTDEDSVASIGNSAGACMPVTGNSEHHECTVSPSRPRIMVPSVQYFSELQPAWVRHRNPDFQQEPIAEIAVDYEHQDCSVTHGRRGKMIP